MIDDDDDDTLCPLCLEQLDITDRHIDFCKCGYRMCLWCWHQIMENAAKDNLPGRCPNCRKEYDRERITKGQVDPSKLKQEREKEKRKDKILKQAKYNSNHNNNGRGGHGAGHNNGTDTSTSRRHLQNVRVIQRNLVYAIGIPLKYCKEDVLRKYEFFGKYGRILKISVNRNGIYSSASNSNGPTGSAYVTFTQELDAVACIKRIDGSALEGQVIRASFGTTKYCNAFLRFHPCNNPDCLYLHEIGEHADSFTKEEMAGPRSKHHSFHELSHPHAPANAQEAAVGAAGAATHSAPLPFPLAVQQPSRSPGTSPEVRVAGEAMAMGGQQAHTQQQPQGEQSNGGLPAALFQPPPQAAGQPPAGVASTNGGNGLGVLGAPFGGAGASLLGIAQLMPDVRGGGQGPVQPPRGEADGAGAMADASNLGAGLGGLFGNSGGGYNFAHLPSGAAPEAAGGGGGGPPAPSLGSMMSVEQLESTFLGNSARTTSRFSFAQRPPGF